MAHGSSVPLISETRINVKNSRLSWWYLLVPQMFPETIAIFKKRNRQCAKNQGKEPAHRHFPYSVRLLNWLGNLFWCEFLLYRFWCLAQRHQPEHLADVSKYIQCIWSIARCSSGLKFSVFSSLTVNCKTFFGVSPHPSDTLKTREWRNDGYCDAFIGEGTESAGFLYFASECVDTVTGFFVGYQFSSRVKSIYLKLVSSCHFFLSIFLSFTAYLHHVCVHTQKNCELQQKKTTQIPKVLSFSLSYDEAEAPEQKENTLRSDFRQGYRKKRREERTVYTPMDKSSWKGSSHECTRQIEVIIIKIKYWIDAEEKKRTRTIVNTYGEREWNWRFICRCIFLSALMCRSSDVTQVSATHSLPLLPTPRPPILLGCVV